jgi:CHASE3 domain sensor protein
MGFFKRWRVPPRRVVLWHAFSALPLGLVVGLGGYLSYHHHVLSTQSREQVNRAYEVLEGVSALFVAVEEANLGERNFVITGSPSSLAAFQGAVQATVDDEGKLRPLLLDNRAQLERLAALERAIAAKTTELGQTVALRQAQGFDAAREAISRSGDERLMERVRSGVRDIFVSERELLQRRQESRRAHEQDILLIGALVAALSVAVRLLVAWVVARLRKRAPDSASDV